MGKSFLLKGLSGRPSGYVMQAPGALRIRIQGIEGKKACLTAVYADGKERTFCVDCTDGEIERPDAGGTLSAAYVTMEGTLALHTGDAARAAFERSRIQMRMKDYLNEEKKMNNSRAGLVQRHEELEKAEEKPRERTSKQTELTRVDDGQVAQEGVAGGKTGTKTRTEECSREMDGQAAGDAAHMECAMPERRWPPPPCMPRARYVSGRWEEG